MSGAEGLPNRDRSALFCSAGTSLRWSDEVMEAGGAGDREGGTGAVLAWG